MGEHARTSYPERGECRRCEAPIIWCINERTGKVNILDAEPRADGNVALIGGKARNHRNAEPLPDDVPRYVSHFVTCPFAADIRSELGVRQKEQDQQARTGWNG